MINKFLRAILPSPANESTRALRDALIEDDEQMLVARLNAASAGELLDARGYLAETHTATIKVPQIALAVLAMWVLAFSIWIAHAGFPSYSEILAATWWKVAIMYYVPAIYLYFIHPKLVHLREAVAKTAIKCTEQYFGRTA